MPGLGDFISQIFGGVKPVNKGLSPNVDMQSVLNKNPVAVRDNTKMVPQNVKFSQKDADDVEKQRYYNPEVKPGYTSGDKQVDFVYNHPWLMGVPILGDKIKQDAYNIAKRSAGSGSVANVDSTKKSAPNYSGSAIMADNNSPKVNLIDQYFGKISLPASKYKPTSDYMTFLPSVSVKGQFDQKHKDGYDMTDMIKDVAGKVNGLDFTKPVYKQNSADSKVAEELGVDLGGHKTGIGFDKQRNLPYVSISDAWDFEPNAYSKKQSGSNPNGLPTDGGKAYIQSFLMHKAGTPFKVYDRLYFDPKTRKYIPDDKLPPVK